MNDLTKTILFGVFGVALATTAFFVDRSARPQPSSARELVGSPFYEDFGSTGMAQALQVSAVSPDAELLTFKIEKKDGLWVIPSHYGYPAEADERLSNTQASVLGIVRETLAAEESSRHRLFGVVDPLSFDPTNEESYDLESYGQRITLYDEQEEVLADFIIGKEVKQDSDDNESLVQNQGEKVYYVRREDEVRTYTAKLNIDLSTKFEDWIKPNLLQVDSERLTRIEIDKFELKDGGVSLTGQISPMRKIQKGKVTLERPDPAGSWAVNDFDDTKETLVNAKLSEIVSVVQDLTISDVRPKTNFEGQPLITPDLKVNSIKELENDTQLFRRLMQQLRDEMDANGFSFINDNGIKLVSKFGNIKVGTDEGISFRLLFGEEFTEQTDDIKISGADAEKTPSDSEKNETEDKPETKSQDGQPGRFMMIEVVFDTSLLKPIETPGTEPTEPVKPEGYLEKQPPEIKIDEKTGKPIKPENVKDERDPKFIEYDKNMRKYETAKTEFELAKTRFETKQKERVKEIADGKQKAADLNQRFGMWYYIIKNENLNSLLSERDDLVQPKAVEKPAENPLGAPPSFPPQRPNIDAPELKIPGLGENKEAKGHGQT